MKKVRVTIIREKWWTLEEELEVEVPEDASEEEIHQHLQNQADRWDRDDLPWRKYFPFPLHTHVKVGDVEVLDPE